MEEKLRETVRQTDEQRRGAEREKKAMTFESLVARIDAIDRFPSVSVCADESMRIADEIEQAFGRIDQPTLNSAEVRLRRLLLDHLDQRMRACLAPTAGELAAAQDLEASRERTFWDGAAQQLAATLAVGCTSASAREVAHDAACIADALMLERRARRASSSAT